MRELLTRYGNRIARPGVPALVRSVALREKAAESPDLYPASTFEYSRHVLDYSIENLLGLGRLKIESIR